MEQGKIDSVISAVGSFYGITGNQLRRGNRERRYSEPRHIAAYCMYRMLHMSYWTIADVFGYRSHRTVVYAVDKVSYWVDHPVFNRKAANCVKQIRDEALQSSNQGN